MSDTNKTPPPAPVLANKTGASGAAWSDAEKIAYLIVLCENEGKVEAKIAQAPIPAGRSVVSCKKLLWRLKEKHKDDIEKIKAGLPLVGDAAAAAPTTEEGEVTKKKGATPRKKQSATQKKRKSGAEGQDGDEDGEGSPKKKAVRKKKGEKEEVKVEEEVKTEEDEG
ncbi:hypothetical protein P153DRAFT_427311 [Dothidotthia symphoricarpi CBS 119687]|uniref:Uncharacterized protein n=1 Tax=Dothidotthia symphoricarpi CBS 119687 TaxID=1392245 RepID=A0A6A6AS76_9PLEO|nr:uncharacterized protein P153DRAFT_427311 [Dothidotthia symphoricarpi CBS 119687]KAF2134650.1 hypothetical protein P153DRAFT_427311 [Dothidotthia symphoricarpi CBS 119687]